MDTHGAGLKVLGGNLVVFQQEIVQGCKGIRPRRSRAWETTVTMALTMSYNW